MRYGRDREYQLYMENPPDIHTVLISDEHIPGSAGEIWMDESKEPLMDTNDIKGHPAVFHTLLYRHGRHGELLLAV